MRERRCEREQKRRGIDVNEHGRRKEDNERWCRGRGDVSTQKLQIMIWTEGMAKHTTECSAEQCNAMHYGRSGITRSFCLLPSHC